MKRRPNPLLAELDRAKGQLDHDAGWRNGMIRQHLESATATLAKFRAGTLEADLIEQVETWQGIANKFDARIDEHQRTIERLAGIIEASKPRPYRKRQEDNPC